jgi:hypothetical protein
MALSGPSLTVPDEGQRPAERIFWVKTHEVNGLHDRHERFRRAPACATG